MCIVLGSIVFLSYLVFSLVLLVWVVIEGVLCYAWEGAPTAKGTRLVLSLNLSLAIALALAPPIYCCARVGEGTARTRP